MGEGCEDWGGSRGWVAVDTERWQQPRLEMARGRAGAAGRRWLAQLPERSCLVGLRGVSQV